MPDARQAVGHRPQAPPTRSPTATSPSATPASGRCPACLVAQERPKTAVDGNGEVVFQVLPGTNSFTAWDGTAYQSETLTVTGAASTSISVA
jgi:hypothetical protein